jgi:hypothetical protein
MAEKEREKEVKEKKPTVEESRKAIKNDIGFLRDITNYVKQMKDNGCLQVAVENDVRNMVEDGIRGILNLPAKPAQPVYTPPTPMQQPQYQPGQPPQYPARPG